MAQDVKLNKDVKPGKLIIKKSEVIYAHVKKSLIIRGTKSSLKRPV